ncbi:MAG: class I SAM-dependent methyltransferase [Anaerolineaceae bacterium]|nr:class I SAM-dependent methyltransferase [Anaerolineaceae bacterium]
MDKQLSRQFFNESAAHWDENARNNDPEKLWAIMERLSFSPDARVLDVGTGTGVFAPYIQSKLNENGRVVCLDFAYQMLAIAIKKNSAMRIDHVCAEIETAGFNAGTFDAVVCYSTFPHFHDKPRAMRNMFNMLTDGGRIFICHSASREFINAIHRNIPDLYDHLIPHKEEMNRLMSTTGFKNIAIAEESESYFAVGEKPHQVK